MLKIASEWIFKWRGGIMALAAAAVLVLARPSEMSFLQGLGVAVLGELWRLYALGYAGEPTRSSTLNAARLWTQGPYALCRNPLYLGNLLNGMGVAWAAAGRWPGPGNYALLL